MAKSLEIQREELEKKLKDLDESIRVEAEKKAEDDNKKALKALDKRVAKARKKGGDALIVKEVILKDAIADSERTIKDFVAPDAINAIPLRYVITEEAGGPTYHCTMYVAELPKNATFVYTFGPLFNYEGVISKVFVEPYGNAASRKLLNKRVMSVGTALNEAEKEGNPNKIRDLQTKYNEAESWAHAVETGSTVLYKVAFMFKITAPDLETLTRKCRDLYNVARESGMELGSCYGGQAEAMLSCAPFNTIFNPTIFGKKRSLLKTHGVKYHIMDKYSLATIYNHTQATFSHKNGIVLGRKLISGKPVLWDPYHKSHNGFSVVVTGMIGAGKSATVKMAVSRYADFDNCRVVVVDLDSPDRNKGEYVPMVKMLGGMVYTLTSDSVNRLNPYDINVSVEWDADRREEYQDLRLDEKINDLQNILLCMVKDGREIGNYNTETYIRKILRNSIRLLYSNIHLVNRDVSSLYTTGQIFENGVITTGPVKKTMPTLSDHYLLLAKMAYENQDDLLNEPYKLILSVMSEWVDDLVYGCETFKRYSYEDYVQMGIDDMGYHVTPKDDNPAVLERVEYVHGIRPYFDGQSNLPDNLDDLKALDLDVSLLPESDKLIAQQICCSYINEYFVKKNSANPKKINKLIFLIDEFHRMFSDEASRKFVSDLYRTSRKKNVSMWTISQSVADYNTTEEGRTIFKNSSAKFILKQDNVDVSILRENTPLTESQIQRVTLLGGSNSTINELDDNTSTQNNEHKGEICLIDNLNVVFLKVDYLKNVEAAVVETDASNINELYRKGLI